MARCGVCDKSIANGLIFCSNCEGNKLAIDATNNVIKEMAKLGGVSARLLPYYNPAPSSGTTAPPIKVSNDGTIIRGLPPSQVYKIGDKGPAGGIVFYDKGNNSDGWRYMEAAPVNQGHLEWGAKGQNVSTRTEIGTGKANTAAILAVDANAPAAKACADYRGGGKYDWFLPSKDELNELYKQRNLFDISSGFFLSSSQYSNDCACLQVFVKGDQGFNGKYLNFFVRAVRAF